MTTMTIGEIRHDPTYGSGGALLRAVKYDASHGIVTGSYLDSSSAYHCVPLETWRSWSLVVVGETRRFGLPLDEERDWKLQLVNDGKLLVHALSCGTYGRERRLVCAAEPALWFAAPIVEKRAEVAKPVIGERRMWKASCDDEPCEWKLAGLRGECVIVKRRLPEGFDIETFGTLESWLRATPVVSDWSAPVININPPTSAFDAQSVRRELLDRVAFAPDTAAEVERLVAAAMGIPIATGVAPLAPVVHRTTKPENRCPKCGGTDDVYVGLNDVEHACSRPETSIQVRPSPLPNGESGWFASRVWRTAAGGRPSHCTRHPTREGVIAALRAAEEAAGLFAGEDE
ncbi:MAG: hypothetical protein IT379_23710 [Deltaproteobacteria bacterium]|nr:hypothetical protein [Deltaproteobacteria bacterium]